MTDAPASNKLAVLRALVAAHDQAHVLRWIDKLAPAERQALLAQLEAFDWAQVDDFRRILKAGGWKPDASERIEPGVLDPCEPGSPAWNRAREVGRNLLRAGKVAVVMVAGGQGTRLGFSGPKGSFPVTPIRRKTLFELHALKVRALGARYGRAIPWYVMTSASNDADTRAFFAQHRYFGLAPGDVQFFTQSMVPALDAQGRLIMESPSRVFMSPNGHGGTLEALVTSGMLADMERRGVEQVFYFQVDNVLMRVADPVFLGLHHDVGAQMSCKILFKRDPFEKLGVVVHAGPTVKVIEYSDLPEALALERDPNGRLRYGAGSIAIHAFRVDFVRAVVSGAGGLPWHLAHKRVPCVDDSGAVVTPQAPNAFKFERFIFDALPMAKRVGLLEVDRAEEFAPVKQAQGEDSPETASRAMVEQAARWLESVGVRVPRLRDGLSRYPLEISPLLAVEPEDLVGKVSKDLVIDGPLYLDVS